MLLLHVWPGAFDLPSLDPSCLVAAAYLQLFKKGEWKLVECTSESSSPNRHLPFFTDGTASHSGEGLLHWLLQEHDEGLSKARKAEAAAFHAWLETTLFPLILHSLFSLPKNWELLRRELSNRMPYPQKLYRPESVRYAAREVVEASGHGWWGLGGEKEEEEDKSRRQKKSLLATTADDWKERNAQEEREKEDSIHNAFGESRIMEAGRATLSTISACLAQSSTSYLLSAQSPTSLDAHLSALLTSVLKTPLSQPILADLLRSDFPLLVAHAERLKPLLWSTMPQNLPQPPSTWMDVINSLVPDFAQYDPRQGFTSSRRMTPKAKTKSDRDFDRRRWYFTSIVVVGTAAWAIGSGVIAAPFIGMVRSEDDEKNDA